MTDKEIIDRYILDGKTPVAEPDLMKWAAIFESGNKVVRQDNFGQMRVSTVFLGLNHSFGKCPPLLFETMVFGGELDQKQDRCSTWEEAERMHELMCERVQATIKSKRKVKQMAEEMNQHTDRPWERGADYNGLYGAGKDNEMCGRTDKEMLIFAAKAYGLKDYEYVDIWGCMAKRLEDGSFDSSTCWNPIDSDSDAFRLAVELRILCVDLGRFTIGCTKATTEEVRKVITLAASNIAKYTRN